LHLCLIISTGYVYNRSNTTIGTTVYVEVNVPDNPENSGPTSILIISRLQWLYNVNIVQISVKH